MTPEQEQKVVQRARQDPQVFVDLYDSYFPRMHAYVRYRVPNPQDAEDLIADVFFRAIRKLGHFKWRGEGSFAAWLFRIAHNLIVDYYRKYTAVSLSLDSGDGLPELTSHTLSPEETLAQEEAFQRMRALVATLSPRRQEIITLRFFGGLRNREIAKVLGLDERTVASHLSRGLRDLQTRYETQVESGVRVEVVV